MCDHDARTGPRLSEGITRVNPLTYAVDPLRPVVFAAQRMAPAARARFPTGIELFGRILPSVPRSASSWPLPSCSWAWPFTHSAAPTECQIVVVGWERLRRRSMRRRSRSEVPPQTPLLMSFASANSRHCTRTGHSPHTGRAAWTPSPSGGKKRLGLKPRHRAWCIQLSDSGTPSAFTT
jgi:hypothetical protein